MTLYDSGHLQQRFVSARDVLNGTVPADKIDGHIIFVGTSRRRPEGPAQHADARIPCPGVEVHAQIVEQMLSQTFLDRPDYADGAEFLYLRGDRPAVRDPAAAAVGRDGWRWSRRCSSASASSCRGSPSPHPPAVRSDLSAGHAGGDLCQRLGARLHADRARARARSAAPSASICRPTRSKAVARNPELLQLGGEQREITVMFTDVRGFTRISEQFDPPA